MHRAKFPLVSLVVTLILVVLSLTLVGYSTKIEEKIITLAINKDKLEKIGRFAYQTDLEIDSKNKFYVRSDTRSHPSRSTLRLYIDGNELPVGHALNYDVIWKGLGRYRHQKGNKVLFSLPKESLSIDEVKSITAKIQLALPKGILKASIFLLVISVLVLIYKLSRFLKFEIKSSAYILRISQFFLVSCLAFYTWHIFKNMSELITFTADSIYYFAPSLAFINDGILNLLAGPDEQGHTFGFIYPALLAIFTLAGSINHVPLIQACLFLCTVGVGFYLTKHSVSSILANNVPLIFAAITSIIMLSYFVYTKYTVEIMPEIVYQLSSLSTIYLLSLTISKQLTFNKLVLLCGAIVFWISF